MLRKRGRPRLASPAHHYTLSQWQAHDADPNKFKLSKEEKSAISFLKREGLWNLKDLSLRKLTAMVRGDKPKCFGAFDTMKSKCEECKKVDGGSTEGFFEDEREVGKSAFGVSTCCLTVTWLQHFKRIL